MKKLALYFFAFFGLFLVSASVTHAATDFFGPIVPLACQTCACGLAAVLETIRHLMNFAVSISFLILLGVLVWAGVLYMTSAANPEAKNQGHKMLTDAFVGLFIVLAAWLMVDFVMKTFYSGPDGSHGKFGPWNSIVVGGDVCILAKPTQKIPGITSTIDINVTGTDVSVVTGPGSAGTESEVRSRLTASGVAIKNPACTNGQMSGCTNVGGFKEATVQQIINLNALCAGGCGITVTGGTEPGHAAGTYSHGQGYKIDLRLGTGMDAAIQSKFISVGTRTGDSGGPAWTDKCSVDLSPATQNQYVKESDHWDIRITAPCTY